MLSTSKIKLLQKALMDYIRNKDTMWYLGI